MKIRIEIDENLAEEEVIVRCKEWSDEILSIQNAIKDITSQNVRFVFYKNETEYYFSLDEILFFETDSTGIRAQTLDEVFNVKYRLYELEELLPKHFIRVSKSTILNINKIYSIDRNLSSSCIVQFYHTHKQIYVSRHYTKLLKLKLEEKRLSL